MGKFAVEPTALAAAVHRMEGFHAEVDEAVQMAASVMARLDESFEGEAASAAQEAHHQLSTGAKQVREAVAQLARFLDIAQKGYTAAISGNSQMWGV